MRARTLAAIVTVMILLLGAIPASATHTHVRATGNGACVILSGNGAEDAVQLPHVDEFPETRRHPLHVNVHLGEAGERRGEAVVWVLGSAGDVANCDGYVND
jgi:hypothetical protein